MSAIPELKKKLKSIRATGKLSKAMKTVSAVKLSKLTAVSKNFSFYYEEYAKLLSVDLKDQKPDVVVIMGSNRGFCGSFNNDTLDFARENGYLDGKIPIISVGEKMTELLLLSGADPLYTCTFPDVPEIDGISELTDTLIKMSEKKEDFAVALIYPIHKNAVTQVPTVRVIGFGKETFANEELLYFPDKETAIKAIMANAVQIGIYGAVLETSLGAQAATLMTMRSAYDTAEEYSASIEAEIQRKRQSEVTADTIETASDRKEDRR